MKSASLLATSLETAHAGSEVLAVALDQESPDFLADLRAIAADIVIHTAGPYQGKGYRVAEACIECGSHYIDLADGRDFVSGFDCLHDTAKQRGVLLVSGASTLPGLSSAVVNCIRGDFDKIDSVAISIAPAHQTPRGTGTIAAVLSYCGRPFDVLVNGEWVTRHGWHDFRRQHYPQFGRRFSAACDVPDLALLPAYLPGANTVTFHAALEAPWEQLALWLMAGLVRLRLVRKWDSCVPAFRWLSDRLIGMGSATGGMQVRVSGGNQLLECKTAVWNLVAKQNHGPEIPCAPALILARKLARRELDLRGAFPCVGLITLSEFDAEVADLDIRWVIEEDAE